MLEKIRRHFVEEHVAYVYEALCRERLRQMADVLPAVDRVGRWWNNKDAEIDIMAYGGEGRAVIFGECKYSASPQDIQVLNDLRTKALQAPRRQGAEETYYVIFSRAGFTKRLRDAARQDPHIVLRDLGSNNG